MKRKRKKSAICFEELPAKQIEQLAESEELDLDKMSVCQSFLYLKLNSVRVNPRADSEEGEKSLFFDQPSFAL